MRSYSDANSGIFNQNPFQQNTYSSRGRYQYPQRRRFYVNGVDISHLFNVNNGNRSFYPNPFENPNNDVNINADGNIPKSIFVQRVTVPLEELYSGVNNKQFQFKDNFLQAYR